MENTIKKYRSKGSGTIFKRGRIYYLQYMINGKIKKISLKCTSYREAESKANSILAPLHIADTTEKLAVHIAHAKKLVKAGKTPISEVWELYLRSQNRPDSSKGTLKNYEGQWKRFKEWLKEKLPSITGLEQITEDIAKEYADDLWNDGLSARTYNNHIKALMLITRILSSRAGVTNNPWNCITRKNEVKQSRKEFTEKEVLHILSVFDDEDFQLPNKSEMSIMFNLGVWTGLRLIDCALMKWSNIDINRNLINCIPVKTRKTNRSVTIPIHPYLKEALNEARKWKCNGYVLPNVAKIYEGESDVGKKDVMKVFKQAGFETTNQDSNGIQRKRKANMYGFHSFRHTFVSFCAKAGVPLPVVQSIVGHSHPAITRHYIHLGEENIKQAINALPQGKEENMKTAEQKIEEIRVFLNDKKKLSQSEQHILMVLK